MAWLKGSVSPKKLIVSAGYKQVQAAMKASDGHGIPRLADPVKADLF